MVLDQSMLDEIHERVSPQVIDRVAKTSHEFVARDSLARRSASTKPSRARSSGESASDSATGDSPASTR